MYNDMNLVIDNKDIKVSILFKILIVLFLVLILFSLVYKVKNYDNYLVHIIEHDDKFYFQTYIPVNNTKFIYNNTFSIDNNKYYYKIINIEDDQINDNNGMYIVVNIETDLDAKYLINNNYINIKQTNISESLFTIILKRIKKGMNL